MKTRTRVHVLLLCGIFAGSLITGSALAQASGTAVNLGGGGQGTIVTLNAASAAQVRAEERAIDADKTLTPKQKADKKAAAKLRVAKNQQAGKPPATGAAPGTPVATGGVVAANGALPPAGGAAGGGATGGGAAGGTGNQTSSAPAIVGADSNNPNATLSVNTAPGGGTTGGGATGGGAGGSQQGSAQPGTSVGGDAANVGGSVRVTETQEGDPVDIGEPDMSAMM